MLLSTIARVSASSPHFRVSDLFSTLSMDVIWPGLRLTRTRAAVVHAGVGVRFVKDHRMDSTLTVVRLIKRYDAFITNRGENGLLRTDRSQILGYSSARAGVPETVRATSALAAANFRKL